MVGGTQYRGPKCSGLLGPSRSWHKCSLGVPLHRHYLIVTLAASCWASWLIFCSLGCYRKRCRFVNNSVWMVNVTEVFLVCLSRSGGMSGLAENVMDSGSSISVATSRCTSLALAHFVSCQDNPSFQEKSRNQQFLNVGNELNLYLNCMDWKKKPNKQKKQQQQTYIIWPDSGYGWICLSSLMNWWCPG